MTDGIATVLLVEDQEPRIAPVREILEADGLRVATAADGVAARAALRQDPPDLILVHAELLDPAGEDAAAHLRLIADAGDRPVVVLATEEDDGARWLALGCVGVLPATLEAETFLPAVREFLAGRRDEFTAARGLDALRDFTHGLVGGLERRISALTDLNLRLENVSEEKTRFIRTVTHELSAPLTPILGYARILRMEQAGTLNDVQRKCLKALQQSAERLKRMIDSLLEVTHLQAGRLELDRQPWPLDEVLGRVAEHHREAAADADVELHVGAAAERDILADQRKLTSALGHVLHNAIKFSPRGARVLLAAVDTPHGTCLAVFDQGPGVPTDQIERIFDDFAQLDGEAVQRAGGAGLGLSIARRIVDSHGGRIWVESPPRLRPPDGEVYEGTCVAVLLPEGD